MDAYCMPADRPRKEQSKETKLAATGHVLAKMTAKLFFLVTASYLHLLLSLDSQFTAHSGKSHSLAI